jgi:hypothetical protein
MKFWYRFKVKEKILEIIKSSSIQNFSNDYINSLSAGSSLPQHVDFHLLVHDTYCICLGDYDRYLYKEKKFNELQAAIFVITKVFQTQSEKPNSHQKMREVGKLGELMSEASITLYVMAEVFLEEEPEMFEPAFNYPLPSIFDDIEKARSLINEDDRTPF